MAVPFTYDLFETVVVQQLQSVLTTVATICEMPEDESEWEEVKTKPVIYVSYEESNFQDSTSTNLVIQEEDVMISCSVRARRRRGEGGIFNMLKLIKGALQGFMVPGTAKPLQLKKIQLINRDMEKKDWEYMISFGTTKMQVQTLENDDTLVENYTGITERISFQTLNDGQG